MFDFIEFAAELVDQAELFQTVHRNKKTGLQQDKPVEQNMKVQRLQQGETRVKARKPEPG